MTTTKELANESAGIRRAAPAPPRLAKAPTGIAGLDAVLDGGLPMGRPTLVCGGPGCGKTMLAVEFLVHGAEHCGEPGVFVAFEETAADLATNVASLGFNLPDLIERGRLAIEYVRVERSEFEETGEYDLEGLFIRLGDAIASVGARRVAIDTIESLFAALPNAAIVRSELRRLFRWLKERGMTTIITGERGAGTFTRESLEEYVTDCVISLDHRVEDEVSTRRLRVVKYRGSVHGTNEYPFLIDERGISVLPITSLGLDHVVSNERVSTGVPLLDAMLGGEGYFRGSSVLVSGTAGSGKTTLAASFVNAACARGERCLYFSFEEAPAQIIRNMRSVAIDLQPWLDAGLLRLHALRTVVCGLEMHLALALAAIEDFQPQGVVIDPVSGFPHGARSTSAAKPLLLRLIDFLKTRGITALLTDLTSRDRSLESTDAQISSLIDTWLLLRDIESSGERNRCLYVLKSRGMAHSNQVREFLITRRGIELLAPYIGPGGVLMGSARVAQEAAERAAKFEQREAFESRQRVHQRRRAALGNQIAALRAELAAEDAELAHLDAVQLAAENRRAEISAAMAHRRQAEPAPVPSS